MCSPTTAFAAWQNRVRYTDLTLEHINDYYPRVPRATYQDQHGLRIFLNDTSFSGSFCTTTLWFTSIWRGMESCSWTLRKEVKMCHSRNRYIRGSYIWDRRKLRGPTIPLDAKPGLCTGSKYHPGASAGYKLFIRAAVGDEFQNMFGRRQQPKSRTS